MKYGFGLPGITDGDTLCAFANKADQLGVNSLWGPDHIVLPRAGTDKYPYSETGEFTRAMDAPFLDVFTLLGYVASHTKNIRIGTTVVILPYRNPILQAKMFASLDVLTNGRVICGVGVGWLQKEFEVMGASYENRGPVSDEWLNIFKILWTDQKPAFDGRFYKFDGIFFSPRPIQKPSIPIWVGGHSRRAVRRAIKYGDGWHPTRMTPEYVAGMLPYLQNQAEQAGRDPTDITVSLKRSIHFTDLAIPEGPTTRSGAALVATTNQVIDDVRKCSNLGIDQLTFDFRTGDPAECQRMMEHFMTEVATAL
ncbi:TIGR03619 family F420-dependent LLM class oxidoreductase [SAR202 cluster bacterium AD-804-J14_MRT_500m]|nr:TIGR03619 family F420-dependent LLM class oxidoreductase [SAR202 cluster bacterium AD-804-J14_MRT_500m]